MINLSAPPRAAGKWIVLGSAVFGLGCRPVGPGYPTDWSTPLPSGVARDAERFRSQVAALGRSTTYHIRARAAACVLGTLCTVQVRIEPIGDTRLINPDNAPEPGVAVARVENLDSRDVEAKYGFKPGIQDIYYLWVDRKPRSLKARWTILQVPMGAGIVTAGHQKDLKTCHHLLPTDIRISDADFHEYTHEAPCDAALSAEIPKVHQASLLPVERVAAFVGRIAAYLRGEAAAQGGWISCSDGCCT